MSGELGHKVQMYEVHDAKKGMAEIRGRKDLQKWAKTGLIGYEKRGIR